MIPQRSLHCLAAAFCPGLAVASPATAAPCDTPTHRAFDFWLGPWQVRTPDGKIAGVNLIEREYDGCVLHERYSTGRGHRWRGCAGWYCRGSCGIEVVGRQIHVDQALVTATPTGRVSQRPAAT